MGTDTSPSAVVTYLGSPILWPKNMSLFAALMQAGVLVPSACAGHGQCGLCVVWLQGAPLPMTSHYEREHLSDEQRAHGARLACQLHHQTPWTVARVGTP